MARYSAVIKTSPSCLPRTAPHRIASKQNTWSKIEQVSRNPYFLLFFFLLAQSCTRPPLDAKRVCACVCVCKCMFTMKNPDMVWEHEWNCLRRIVVVLVVGMSRHYFCRRRCLLLRLRIFLHYVSVCFVYFLRFPPIKYLHTDRWVYVYARPPDLSTDQGGTVVVIVFVYNLKYDAHEWCVRFLWRHPNVGVCVYERV